MSNDIEQSKNPYRGFMDNYPILFQNKSLPASKTCMCWGIECPGGWLKTLTDLCNRIEFLNNDLGKQLGFKILADQVKEKYGTLRFYFSVIPDDYETETEELAKKISMVEDIVEDLVICAENTTANICQVCGCQLYESNRVMSGGWIGYYCKDCAEKKGIMPYEPRKHNDSGSNA